MLKVKTAVLVSGGGTNLQALLDQRDRGKLPCCDLCLVVSNRRDAFALERARRAGVAAVAVEDRRDGRFETELRALLDERGIELIVLAGFLAILSSDFTARYPQRILNIHPSLIPAFCGQGFYGLRVHQAALARGVKLTGATVHYVNEIPDGGEILLQKAVAVRPGDTAETLQRRVMEEAEWQLLPAAVDMVSGLLARAKEEKA